MYRIPRVLLLCAVVAGCDDPSVPAVPEPVAGCGLTDGTLYESLTITAPSTWSAAASPHVIEGRIRLEARVTVEAGAVVCARAGAGIVVGIGGYLSAQGTPAEPVLLVPDDGSWGGVDVEPYGGLTLRHAILRRAGIRLGSRTSLTLDGGRIEHSTGDGIAVIDEDLHLPRLTVQRPVRIVGSAGYPARVPADWAGQLIRSAADSDSLRGNGTDALVLMTNHVSGTIYAGLPWIVVPWHWGHPPLAFGPLRLEPGAEIHLRTWTAVTALHAVGTPEAPVRIVVQQGDPHPLLLVRGGDTSRVRHAVIIGNLDASGPAPILIDSSLVRGLLSLRAPRSRFTDSWLDRPDPARFEGLGFPQVYAGLELWGEGSLLDGSVVSGSTGRGVAVRGTDIMLRNCEIRDNAWFGLLAYAGASALMTDCNLIGNGEAGVRAEDGAAVDARGNWWGDPDGPLAAAGDGVEGEVEYAEWRTTPVIVQPRTP